MRHFFLKNHAQNVTENLFPDPLLRNLVYLWINSLKGLYSLFLLYTNLRAVEIK